jgi:hypothetical protein
MVIPSTFQKIKQNLVLPKSGLMTLWWKQNQLNNQFSIILINLLPMEGILVLFKKIGQPIKTKNKGTF